MHHWGNIKGEVKEKKTKDKSKNTRIYQPPSTSHLVQLDTPALLFLSLFVRIYVLCCMLYSLPGRLGLGSNVAFLRFPL